ncbi:co-chaperone protein HscB homolog [Toxorhynchites rutilus septentrionalis]|uniref:co-chaperone protein HscB homolog n=1 Tax=Toxorhynchites rutilus septentrionalis TaxID=329112 RepID=UPI00247ACEA5|nr:co-chaperone protein HscB homolog [Toxorhynchites rutilus septentrionalis]
MRRALKNSNFAQVFNSIGRSGNEIKNKMEYCSIPNICWSCNKQLMKQNSCFCTGCGSLQKVGYEDYFKLLDVPSTFNLDSSTLTSNFRRLQSQLHPDKFSQKSIVERNNSLEWSSLVNKAYKTLSLPLERGKYILQQNGIRISEDNTSVDSEFLMDMMERNEQVEEAVERADLENIARDLRLDINNLYDELNVCFANNNLEGAKIAVIRLKYLLNIEAIVKEKMLKYM